MRRILAAFFTAAVLLVPVGIRTAVADQPHTTICHPVGSATGGNTHAGYSIITPADPSSHIDEVTGEPKHEHDGRVDFVVDATHPCPPSTPTPTPTPTPVPTPTPTPEPETVDVPYRVGLRMAPDAPFNENGVLTVEEGSTLKLVFERCDTSLGFVVMNDGVPVLSHTFVAKPSRSTLRVTVGTLDVKEVARNRGKACIYRTYTEVV